MGDVKVQFLGDPPEPTFYFSLDQLPASEVFFVARGSGGTGDMVAGLRRALLEMDPDILLLQAQSMKDRIGVNLYPVRLAAAYLGTFGMMALLLAAIGLYGVVSLSVSRRTREVGIRMSIGADAGRVVAMVLKGSLKSVAVGAIIGMVLAMGMASVHPELPVRRGGGGSRDADSGAAPAGVRGGPGGVCPGSAGKPGGSGGGVEDGVAGAAPHPSLFSILSNGVSILDAAQGLRE